MEKILIVEDDQAVQKAPKRRTFVSSKTAATYIADHHSQRVDGCRGQGLAPGVGS